MNLFITAQAPDFWDFMLYGGYFVLLLAVVFTIVAQYKVQTTFHRYSQIQNTSGMTGAAAAQMVLEQNHVYGVRIERVNGTLTDHYDPRTNVIRLSDQVYDAATPAAVGVAAHEAGHAVQYAENYLPVKIRTAMIPVTNYVSRFAMPLLLIGFILNIFGLMYLGILAFSASVLVQLVTLPCEFNASRRAIKALESSGSCAGQDLSGASKVLSAAAMTYVAALAVSLVYLLRYIALARGRKK